MSAPAPPLTGAAGPDKEPHRQAGAQTAGRGRVWLGRAIGLFVAVALFGGVLPRLVDIEAVGEILRTRVTAVELVLPVLLTAGSVLASALALRAGLPGLRLRSAALINVVTTALSYALPGGGAAGAALNVTMTKELGFGTRPVALQVLVTGVWNLAVRLTLPLLALGLLGIASDVPGEVHGASVAGLLLAAGLIAAFVMVVWYDRPVRGAVSVWHRLTGPVARRFGHDGEYGPEEVARFQGDARALLRSRWRALTTSTLTYHLCVFGVLYTSLQAAGVSRVGVLEAFAVYAVARQVTAIPLTPGSAGVLELALIGGLDLTGADLPAAAAGVLLFRFFTFLLYFPVGGALWLRWGRRRPEAPARPDAFRHPGDVARLGAGLLGLALLALVARGVPAWDADLFRLLNGLPDAINTPAWLVMQAGWVGAVGLAATAMLLIRRFRLAIDLALAGVVAWILAKVVKGIAGRPRPAALLDEVVLRADAMPGGTGFVAGHAAVAAALVTVGGAYLPRPYRRALWLVVAAVGAARVYVGAHFPLDVLGGALLGWAIGSAVLLLRGAPGHRPQPSAVRAALARHGVEADAVEQVNGDLRRAVPFAVTTKDDHLFVKAVGRDQRDADLLHRFGRIWRRRPGDPPFATPKHQTEHEGYLLIRAARAGARVPRLRFVIGAGTGTRDADWALVMDLIGGRPPNTDADLGDAVLDDLWRQLALLRGERIAHRDLRADNIVIDGDGRPWIVGWGAAEAETTAELLDDDAAALLTMTAGIVGPDRAIGAAVRTLGTSATAAAIGRMPIGRSVALRDEMSRLLPAGSPPAPPRRSRRRRPRSFSPFPPRTPATARHLGDVVRVTAGLILCLVPATFAADGLLLGLEADAFRLVNDLPGWLFGPVSLVMQAGALGAVAVTSGAALLARRVRAAVDLALAGALAWVLAKLIKDVADRGRPGALLSEVVLRGAHEGGLGFVSGHAAVAAALATVATVHVRRPVRWLLWSVAVAVALARVYVGAHFPLDVIAGAALGWAIGGAIHLVRGTPAHIPTREQIAAGLARCGLADARPEPLKSDARGSVPFTASTPEGRRVFVKALGRDQRDADLLFKGARLLLYREVEDEPFMAGAKRQVEHEAYMLLRAAEAGVRVPALVGVAPAGPGTWILAEEAVTGGGDLAGAVRDRIDERFLRALWSEVAALHGARIAHRDLRLANVLIDADGRPVLVDFGFAEESASPTRLAQDVAELLVSTALVSGARTAVRAAASVLDGVVLSRAGAFLQPLALARSTRTHLRRAPDLLDLLRRELSAQGVLEVDGRPLSRLPTRPWMLLLGVAAGYATYHALFGITGARHPAEVLSSLAPRWLVVAILLIALSYAAGALTLMGASSLRLALGRTYLHQVAASYAARQHRPGRGSGSVLAGYLRSHGARPDEAVATVAITRLTGAAVHVAALALALAATAVQGWAHWRSPTWAPAVLLAAAVIAAGGGTLLWWRRAEVTTPLRAAALTFPERLRRPGHLVLLVAGNAAVTSCSVLAFLSVARAVEIPASATALAALFLVVMPLRLLGPLPGGLGVVEPLLVLGLVALGAGATEAVIAVLAFRVLSYWLPILPGIAIFRRIGRT